MKEFAHLFGSGDPGPFSLPGRIEEGRISIHLKPSPNMFVALLLFKRVWKKGRWCLERVIHRMS
ncbi:MAG: hypothetical protein NPIRA03_17050 [Nitrospirales bacterium]|nr:MAG: hypothetical protein NPIRA03_17050 [Nitrospirales bacterium]